MSLSRWKMMAGVLGVSIGGLAAAASQCPKIDKTKGRQPDAPVTAEAPKVPPAGAPSAPATPPPLPVPGPSAPQLAPAGTTPPMVPPAPVTEAPKVPAATSALPAIPDFAPPAPVADLKPTKPVEMTAPALTLPGIPETGVKPLPTPKPIADAPKTTLPAPTGDLLPPPVKTNDVPKTVPPAPLGFDLPQGKPVASPPVVAASGTLPPPPSTGMSTPGAAPSLPVDPPAVIDTPPAKPNVPSTTTSAATVAATKFRILLRVGEGEPTFEVKCGDDLVLKVACEKVDIKSPEKGTGLSAVTAKGKVRFAGFGAEGTCDELSFMAGTGEVSMSGEVKVQVKDKLGRVESELTTATLKYKIDANAVGNSIKP